MSFSRTPRSFLWSSATRNCSSSTTSWRRSRANWTLSLDGGQTVSLNGGRQGPHSCLCHVTSERTVPRMLPLL
ncbi:hypothetical protein ANANG_G00199470 [Anguilla anguilla]|uniref:Uncharacterized protein n=1 Tax=Anguilla anguilla TaxID=7936 RepID=A0A9D3M492_ANGAN|nr:hypothetical protein ANANG_G00199470 [Anguilla anguilla]